MVTRSRSNSPRMRDLLRVREAVAAGEQPPGHNTVPRPILESWTRSAGHRVRYDRVEPPYAGTQSADGELQTVLETVAPAAGELGGEEVSLVLTDGVGRVVRRWCPDRALAARLDRVALAPGFVYSESGVGTNGIGTALTRRSATLVRGEEHYTAGLSQFACAGAPVLSPLTGEVVALVDLTTRTSHGLGLMVPFVQMLARAAQDALRPGPRSGGAADGTTTDRGRLKNLERDAIADALARCGGDKQCAADLLGLSRATVYRRIRRYGLCHSG